MIDTMTDKEGRFAFRRCALEDYGFARSRPPGRILGVILAAVLTLLSACAMRRLPESRPGEETIRAWELVSEVAVLASPQMEGRASGSPGAARAAELIANEFRKAGLRPGGEGGGYLQPFDLIANVRAGKTTRLSVTIPGTPPRESRVDFMGVDFNPFSLSEDGEVEAELVFVGYGITAPELGYDDYASVDVKGKAVLAFTHEPRERDPQGPFRASGAFHYATNRYKAMNAREHGAAAILLMLDPNNHGQEREFVYSLTGASSPGSGIVAISLKSLVAEALLRQTGLRPSKLQQQIDERLAPKSFLVPEAKIRVKVALIRERGRTANVIGILPGRDPVLKEEAVVIGAHYDHLGLGGENSLAPDQPSTVHLGADDNASGVAALVALARAFVAAGGGKRTLVFVAFSGEEVGLVGSQHYVKQPPVPLERTVAMMNLDSVGRMRDQRLYVQGVDSGDGLRAIVREASRGFGLDLLLRDDDFGPSDHTPFYGRERPVLHFFTGPHLDYHRPSDTVDKINAEGLRVVTTIAYRTVATLANRAAPITYRRTKGTLPAGGSGERTAGYDGDFGSIPDPSKSQSAGVMLGGVRPDSPAERSGLRAG
ncbi:MAG: M20/M25/M40 family metallo-hydrolase, partial [Candidatus Methylomirabilis sp.]